MQHIVHCRLCHAPIDIDKADKTSWTMPKDKWYYHTNCYEDFIKKQADLGDANGDLQETDAFWKSATYNYLIRSMKIIVNYNKFNAQWSNYLSGNKYKFTAKGIYFSVKWFYEIKKGEADKADGGIGIVPYIYDEATRYWGTQWREQNNYREELDKQIKYIESYNPKIVLQKAKVKPKKACINMADIAAMAEDD